MAAGTSWHCGGGGAKPAESPEPAGDDKAASADKPAEGDKSDASKPDVAKSDDKADAKPEAKADAKPKPADDGGPKPTRTPTDILTAPDTLFLFSFNDSDAKQASETKCDAKAGNDPKKKNEEIKGVFVMVDGEAQFRKVRTGIASDTDLEVWGDVKPDEKVVSGPNKVLRQLKPGSKIKVEETKGKKGEKR